MILSLLLRLTDRRIGNYYFFSLSLSLEKWKKKIIIIIKWNLKKKREEQQQPGTEIVLFWSQFYFIFFFARARFQSVGRGIFVPFWLCFVFLSQLSIDIYFSSCFFYFVILKWVELEWQKGIRNHVEFGKTFFGFYVLANVEGKD